MNFFSVLDDSDNEDVKVVPKKATGKDATAAPAKKDAAPVKKDVKKDAAPAKKADDAKSKGKGWNCLYFLVFIVFMTKHNVYPIRHCRRW